MLSFDIVFTTNGGNPVPQRQTRVLFIKSVAFSH